MKSEEEIIDQANEFESKEKKRKFRRFTLIIILLVIGFIIVLVKLFILQILDTEKYQIQAKKQQESKIVLHAERGNIYDREHRLLSSSIYSISIAIDPNELNKPREKTDNKKNKDTIDYKIKVCSILENAFGLPADSMRKKIDSSKSSFIWIMRGLPYNKYSYLETINCRGLIKIKEPKRNYLYGPIASQIIGLTNIDNKGIMGLEQKFDDVLSGRSGYMLVNRDAFGRIVSSADLPVIPAVNGNSIVLTIDILLQNILEHELRLGVVNSGAVSGTAIAMNPATGEILAMASYPNFDPNNIKTADTVGMKLRAITDVYEPGSTFKLITASAAIEEKIVSPGDTLDGCDGYLKIQDYEIRDAHPIGKVPFAEAMERSSNVIFSTVANKMKDYQFYKYVRDFGFGITLGIDFPGEVPGRIKKPEKFDPGTKRFLGFGYGIMATPLQVVSAYSTVANGGILMKPYLVESILDKDGNEIYQSKHEKIRQVVSKETCDTVTSMLRRVVEGKNGTGKRAKLEGLSIAGKTGTSKQVIEGRYMGGHYYASFAGFFPAESPKVTMLIILDRPQGDYFGGETAAPIFSKIAARWAAVNPTILNLDNSKDYVIKQKDTIIVPNIIGMMSQDAQKYLKKIGLILKSNDDADGIILMQNPKAGNFIAKNQEVKVEVYSDSNKGNKASHAEYPDVKGLSLRRAINILHAKGIKVKIHGRGIVYTQRIQRSQKDGLLMELFCK